MTKPFSRLTLATVADAVLVDGFSDEFDCVVRSPADTRLATLALATCWALFDGSPGAWLLTLPSLLIGCRFRMVASTA